MLVCFLFSRSSACLAWRAFSRISASDSCLALKASASLFSSTKLKVSSFQGWYEKSLTLSLFTFRKPTSKDILCAPEHLLEKQPEVLFDEACSEHKIVQTVELVADPNIAPKCETFQSEDHVADYTLERYFMPTDTCRSRTLDISDDYAFWAHLPDPSRRADQRNRTQAVLPANRGKVSSIFVTDRHLR